MHDAWRLLLVMITPPLHSAAGVEGCYRADRPLAESASGGVPAAAAFRLLSGGRVARYPVRVMGSGWERASGWTQHGDTLVVRLSTGLSGWELRLLPAPTERDGTGDVAWVGPARYLTDVVVRDGTQWRPPRVLVRVRRESCPSPEAAIPSRARPSPT